MQPSPPLELSQRIQTQPDLVDRIFEYIFSDPALSIAIEKGSVTKIKAAVRAEFRGEECYIASRPATARQETVAQVLALFNGRNAREVARRLQISRATVYRVIKQPGGSTPPQNSLTFPELETAPGVPCRPHGNKHTTPPWPTPPQTSTQSKPPLPAASNP